VVAGERANRDSELGFGVSVLLVAVGALLVWGLDRSVRGLDLSIVGAVLLVLGVARLALGLGAIARPRRRAARRGIDDGTRSRR
jgi:hypothetical protein